MSTNNCAARLARSSVNFQIEALTTTRARSRKRLVLCLYKKIIRADQAKGSFTHFVQRDQHIKFLIMIASSILKRRFRFSSGRSFLNLPLNCVAQTQTTLSYHLVMWLDLKPIKEH